ncbi:hypothetical protein CC85DRAFT_313261 [Cutaneotrichosporon oleaginosum]|uniref:Phospholipase A2 n=1 Tax=Cutaneotrichosporon oleaginosum TaxID=879819 RepID=A0A0J0XHC9_9TREE|nr:uncharacterized protein CC85DRAFT_313261 [Cutaneotrichosporon oleaginosum]KLT40530.1 hypothetical protein CC85DRAFT_313261 [Cutaneotrichosporon oleaginosum]TXT08399.1 hypothetical protein COLE_05323 [Cutaneotrichosporon oleaginosum]
MRLDLIFSTLAFSATAFALPTETKGSALAFEALGAIGLQDISPRSDLTRRDDTGRCRWGRRPESLGLPHESNGCGSKSTHWVPEMWYGSCCDAHDACYADCGQSKRACDDAFIVCMQRNCHDQVGGLGHGEELQNCIGASAIYWASVRLLGGRAFSDATDKYCRCV